MDSTELKSWKRRINSNKKEKYNMVYVIFLLIIISIMRAMQLVQSKEKSKDQSRATKTCCKMVFVQLFFSCIADLALINASFCLNWRRFVLENPIFIWLFERYFLSNLSISSISSFKIKNKMSNISTKQSTQTLKQLLIWWKNFSSLNSFFYTKLIYLPIFCHSQDKPVNSLFKSLSKILLD